MKKLICILLLISSICNAQTYKFNSIDKRTFEPGWEIRKIAGTVVFTDSTVTFTMPNRIQVLTIISSNQFIRQNSKIFMCVDENGYQINLQILWECIENKKYGELYYYSDVENKKYFRFCLEKI